MIFKKDIFTIPNLLSLLRLALVPVYATLYLKTEHPLLAAMIFAFSCLTDLLDGYIARRFHMISNLGKILDPLADKITQLAVILCLSTRYPLVSALIPLFLTKEIIQSLLAYLYLRNGKILSGALWAGKICTAVLFTSLVILMMKPAMDLGFVKYLVIMNGLFLSLSLASYLNVYFVNTGKLCDT